MTPSAPPVRSMAVEPGSFHLLVPGSLDQRTGGYLYDARMTQELRSAGWTVTVHELAGRFPDVDAQARTALAGALDSLPDGDLVVVDGLASGALPDIVAAHARRLSMIVLVHHPLADETGLSPEVAERLRVSETEALSHIRGVIVTSLFTAERLQRYGVPADRIRAVLPGTDPARPARGPGEGHPPRLVCVGTLAPRKGQDVLVRALHAIRDLAWDCTCAGSLERDPSFSAHVLGEVDRLGLTDRIAFTGELEAQALEEVYATATLFVLPSHYEGYGMALAEALARGLPVVSTSGGAIPHTVPSDAGILVTPGDAGELADALRTLLEDEARRADLSRAARRHAGELPGWKSRARVFGAAVTELADRA